MTDLTHCDCGCIYEEAVCPNCNYKSPEDRIKELENSLAWYQMMDAMSSDHVVELTDKLEAAEAKLTKAVEALRKIGKTYSADCFRLIHSDKQIINMVYIALAELEWKE